MLTLRRMILVPPDQFTITPLPRHPGTDPFLLRLEPLRALLRYLDVPCWIGGGALRDAAAGVPHKDVDVFFATSEAQRAAVARMMDGSLRGDHQATIADDNEGTTKLSTVSGPVDLIKIHDQSPLVSIARYDFIACAAAITDEALVHHTGFFLDVANRQLRLLGEARPRSHRRALRFIETGWTIADRDMALLMAATERYQGDADYQLDLDRLTPPKQEIQPVPCWRKPTCSIWGQVCPACGGTGMDARPRATNASAMARYLREPRVQVDDFIASLDAAAELEVP